MHSAVTCIKSPGAALFTDTATCRTITLSRPDALNAMSLPMVQDLHRLYITEPHPNEDAVYVVRGDGRRSFCAGGDLKALTGPEKDTHNPLFYRLEYEVDSHIAVMRRTQVTMWAGHVLGSGVGVSVHSRYRVACETTRFAMPETQIGGANDVATSWVFSSLPICGLGMYLAITGNTLQGADVFHAGLATHYIPVEKFGAVEAALAALPSSEGVEECLRGFSEDVAVPPFTLAENAPVLAKAFGAITPSTHLRDIMDVLRADGSAFAASTLKVMERNSPLGMTLALENMKRQHTPGCNTVMESFRGDYTAIQTSICVDELAKGVEALFVTKEKRPQWTVGSVDEVDVELVKQQFVMTESTVPL
ncbi:3-hydroxyisobutyryl-coenzyme a hydrolase-like protein [Leishmania donovani]|uniref:3-hydroxyisobutyryl-CoA hydrolase n=2 Tax=Leishmania donovani TaxID=5661 RepID=A0A504XJE2_LEIDO|nr:2-enoyl-CoA Hydratase C-terminal region family protein [Leishmania donovani]TPP47379.1 2-enoyl-CoA Hydratase C-terminal region family protein [Leishmania donovani]TPP47380.1 2-enoyl-CoA Hydratase C-terminal region family protein [Leishmania donovani]TPP47381.1 2-enoyl-CoA Hydratase C-terminal region family protein [Leishmania donovani]TPP47382.1 2-enoyl-CoA Hydratase C-terminal region family protein [Leishmania donovani]